MKHKNILISGTIFLALAVLLGAFGAHALKSQLSPEMLQVYKTGVEYQFYHALGLLLIGLIGQNIAFRWIGRSAILIGIGIVLFSGSLYILAISGIKIIGAITPIGGLAFVGGWICLAVAVWKNQVTNS